MKRKTVFIGDIKDRTPIKMTFIGSKKAGKTAFRATLTSSPFDFENYRSTIGADFARKDFKKNTTHKWYIFDTAGEKILLPIITPYIKTSQAVLIFVDATRPAKSIRELTGFKDIPKDAICAVVFTKSDLQSAFEFSDKTCRSYVADVQRTLALSATQFKTIAPYFVTSAKTGAGINEAMEAMEATIPLPAASQPLIQQAEAPTMSIADPYAKDSRTKAPRVALIFVDSTRPAESIQELVDLKTISENSTCAVVFTKSDHEEAFEFTEEACQFYMAEVQRVLGLPATQFEKILPCFITSESDRERHREPRKTARQLNDSHEQIALLQTPRNDGDPTANIPGWLNNVLIQIFGDGDEQKTITAPAFGSPAKTITVPAFGEDRSNTLFPSPRERREERTPKINITFSGLSF